MKYKQTALIATFILMSGSVFAFGIGDDKEKAQQQGQTPSMAQLDANMDGVVSQEEAKKSTTIQENFAKADKNKDGKLDRMEFAIAASASRETEEAE